MENTTDMNFCPGCGAELNGAKFCPNCGRQISKANEAFKQNVIDANNIKKQISDFSSNMNVTHKNIMSYIAAGISLVFIILQFCNWFKISLGGFGLVADYFAEGVSEAAVKSYSVVTLLLGVVSLGEIAGESSAIVIAFIFSIILIFLALYIVFDSIVIIKNVYNGHSVSDMISPVSIAVIIQSGLAIVGVWILQSMMKLAMGELGLETFSFAIENIVTFTKVPVIMIILAIVSKLVFGRFAGEEKEENTQNLIAEFRELTNYELINIFCADETEQTDRKIAFDILSERNVMLCEYSKEYNNIWNLVINFDNERIERLLDDPREAEFVKAVARQVLQVRNDM